MNRPASFAGSMPSPAQVGRTLRGLVPSRRGAGKALLIIAAIVMVLAAIAVFSPLAHPRTLEVTGVSGSHASAIQDAIETEGHKQSTFAVSESDLMKAVSDYPEVASVRIQAHPPFRLDLTVVMRPPVARVSIGGDGYVVAADGTVLSRAGMTSVPKVDASISGLLMRDGSLTGARGVLKILGAAPAPMLALARSIRAGHSGLEVVMERGPRLIFGNSQYAADKWAAADAVLADGPAVNASYIDVRVPGRPAVGGLGGSHAAGYADGPPSIAVDPAAAAAAAPSAATPQGTAIAGTQTPAPTAVSTPSAVSNAPTGSGTGTGTSAPSTVSTGQVSAGTSGTAVTPASGSTSTGGATLSGGATP